jgi:hypothetical protein
MKTYGEGNGGKRFCQMKIFQPFLVPVSFTHQWRLNEFGQIHQSPNRFRPEVQQNNQNLTQKGA